MKFTLLFVAFVFMLAGCQEDSSSDAKQRIAQEALASQGNATVGMPAIVNFQEKRILKDIIEMRDKAIVTITYTQDLNAGLHKLCDSVGFGISSATQYTNPSRLYHPTASAITTLPQADPNGLFSPSSAEGTWVMCKDPASGKVAPVYTEPRIIVSTFPLK